MLSIAKSLAGFGIAAALSSSAAAQGIVLQKNITLALAQDIANAAIAQCRSMGYEGFGNDRRSRGAESDRAENFLPSV